MLYYNFRNFEEFKELFGIQHHGNGEKSRKNKILLSYIKNRTLLHNAVISGNYHLLHISSMAELKKVLTEEIQSSGECDNSLPHRVMIRDYTFHSALCRTDSCNGLCEDGDIRSFRYVSVENGRIFKMKIGKLYRQIILETTFGKTLPEQVINYLCEEMTQDWQTYTRGFLSHSKLSVNQDFERLYDSNECVGDFHSCMTDKGYHTFYENAVDASAAYLENEDEKIIARCIIYNEAKDQYGKIWRLAERQYSTECNDILKRALVETLIKGGHIDGYKTVGAGCSDSQAFVDTEGNSLSSYNFSISCDLDYGDTLSYQDSFKNYNEYKRVATNFGEGDIELDTTEGEIEDSDDDDDAYDDYHECYCAEVTRVYYRGREMYCNSNSLDDFIWVDDENEYHHEDDVNTCEECGDNFLSDNGTYSDITEEYYCCSTCLEKAEEKYKEKNWTHSDYDNEYFEDEDDVVEYFQWLTYSGCYVENTISRDTLDQKLDEGDFYCIEGEYYDTIDEDTKLPYGKNLVPEVETESAA